jgi:hypothetical protein
MDPVTLRRLLLVIVIGALVVASVALGWVAAHWGVERGS